MFAISLLAVYLLYLIFLVGFFVFSAFGLYHLQEYGYVGDFSKKMIYLYVGIAAAIMLVTVAFLLLTSLSS